MKFLFPIVLLLLSGCTEYSNHTTDSKDAAASKLTTFGDSVSMAPYLFKDRQGDIWLSWTEQNNNMASLKFSKYSDGEWSPARAIASGKSWFVNWADYPVMAMAGNAMLAHHLQKSGNGTYDYSIELSTSNNSGKSWSPAGKLHDDAIAAEHGFVSMTTFKDDFLISWLDGRNMKGDMHNTTGSMTLRTALINQKGEKYKEWEVDPMVCDCCQTSTAITSAGPVVVYRNRTETEIRDIYISRLIEDTWTDPEPVSEDHWKITGCPVNGPQVIARQSHVAVAWFSAAEENPSVQVSFSDNNGKSFFPPVVLNQDKPSGRVDIDWSSDKGVLITWIENSKIVGASVSLSGEIEDRYVITDTDESRSSGFPQLVWHKNNALIAWTDPSSGQVKLRSLKP